MASLFMDVTLVVMNFLLNVNGLERRKEAFKRFLADCRQHHAKKHMKEYSCLKALRALCGGRLTTIPILHIKMILIYLSLI